MDKTMTQVRDEIRLMNGGGLPTSQQIGEWADAIDAAIKAREAEPVVFRYMRDYEGAVGFSQTCWLDVRDAAALLKYAKSEGARIEYAYTAPPAQPKAEVTEAQVQSVCEAMLRTAIGGDWRNKVSDDVLKFWTGEVRNALKAAFQKEDREAEPNTNMIARAKALLDLLESDFGQSGRDIRIEAIACELESVYRTPPAQPKAEVTDAMVERAWMALTGRAGKRGYERDFECMLDVERKSVRDALEAALSQEPQS